jgi:hypothetical protein
MSSFVNAGTPQLFKYLYPENGWHMLVSAARPFLAMVPKGEAASGVTTSGAPQGASTGIIHVWNYSNPQSASMSHGSALNQQDSLVTGTQVLVQLSQFYSYLRFNAKELAASKNSMASYMSTKKLNFDQAIEQISLELDLSLHRAGNGVLGTLTNVTGQVLTLSSTTSIQQFQKGMRIVSSSTAPVDGTTPALGPGSALVTGVGQTYTGTGFTITLTVDNAAGFDSTTNKYVIRLGNALGFSSTNQEGNMIGMGNWVPTVDPAANDNFLGAGINRSTDIFRLSGVRIAAGGRTYREAIQENCAVIHSLGGRVDTVLMNPIDWQKCNIELQGYARYEEFEVGRVAFSALVIASPSGNKLRLMSDPNQDVGTVRLLTMDAWKLWHLGDLVHTIMDDGLELRKDPGADAFQLGIRAWPQLVCFDPRANGVITGF